jgi:hypothetical protein
LPDQLFEKEIVDQLKGRLRPDFGNLHEIITKTESQLMERQEMDIEKGRGGVTREGLFQMLDQRDRWDNNRKWSKGIVGLTAPNVLDQGTFENGMKRPGDDAKHVL